VGPFLVEGPALCGLKKDIRAKSRPSVFGSFLYGS